MPLGRGLVSYGVDDAYGRYGLTYEYQYDAPAADCLVQATAKVHLTERRAETTAGYAVIFAVCDCLAGEYGASMSGVISGFREGIPYLRPEGGPLSKRKDFPGVLVIDRVALVSLLARSLILCWMARRRRGGNRSPRRGVEATAQAAVPGVRPGRRGGGHILPRRYSGSRRRTFGPVPVFGEDWAGSYGPLGFCVVPEGHFGIPGIDDWYRVID